MLLFKRLLTALVLFVVLFFVVFFGLLVVGGSVSGMQAGQHHNARTFNEGYAVGEEAGREFGQKWAVTIRNTSLVVALVGAGGLAFSGALPWCRRPAVPPSLPTVAPPPSVG